MCNIKVSLDGGETFVDAPSGVRIIYSDVEIPNEEATGELHLNATHEGLVSDVWGMRGVCPDQNLGSSSQLIEDMVYDLVGDTD